MWADTKWFIIHTFWNCWSHLRPFNDCNLSGWCWCRCICWFQCMRDYLSKWHKCCFQFKCANVFWILHRVQNLISIMLIYKFVLYQMNGMKSKSDTHLVFKLPSFKRRTQIKPNHENTFPLKWLFMQLVLNILPKWYLNVFFSWLTNLNSIMKTHKETLKRWL